MTLLMKHMSLTNGFDPFIEIPNSQERKHISKGWKTGSIRTTK